jgi:hypothetical protein
LNKFLVLIDSRLSQTGAIPEACWPRQPRSGNALTTTKGDIVVLFFLITVYLIITGFVMWLHCCSPRAARGLCVSSSLPRPLQHPVEALEIEERRSDFRQLGRHAELARRGHKLCE